MSEETRVEVINRDSLEHLQKLPDNSVDCILTDPPYGIEYTGNKSLNRFHDVIEGDEDTEAFKFIIKESERLLKEDRHAYFFCRWDVYPELAESVPESMNHTNLIVWDKMVHGMGDLEIYAPQHEFIMVVQKGKRPLLDGRKVDVMRVQRVGNDKHKEHNVHPNQKPIKLLKQLIKSATKEGETILDPFAGSGSTAVASKLLNRNCLAVEIDEEYAKVAKDRVKKAGSKLGQRKLTNG